MSQPLPDITVPDAASRFNNPPGEGFARWFAVLKATISVALLEARNQAVTSSRDYTDVAATSSRAYTDESVFAAINVTGLALDENGTPYFSPGSMNPRVFMDPDGTIYFREL